MPQIALARLSPERTDPALDAARQAILHQGHEVGALAKQLFPGGIEFADGITDLDETIRLTK